MRPSRRAAALAATGALFLTGIGASQAAPPAPEPKTLAKGLLSPLSAAQGADGTRYVTQNFAGELLKVRPGKRTAVLWAHPSGGEVGGVSVRRGRVLFLVTKNQGAPNAVGKVMELEQKGEARAVADIAGFEADRNPDAGVTYGFRSIEPSCEEQIPEDFGPAAYTGIVDSHPYASEQTRRRTYVADAAANAVLSVSRTGNVRTVALLPAADATITSEAAAAFGLPECTVGLDYSFEPVPTDVERGPDGKLYVTTLPGGPEDGSLGALASVYKVNPRSGKVTQVVDGLISATNLAIAPSGDLYVTQLFAGSIVRIKAGKTQAKTYAEAPLPGAVEWTPDGLLATVNVLSGLEDPPERALRDVAGQDRAAGPAGKLVLYRD